MSEERIPIDVGCFVYFSPSGRALAGGKAESTVVGLVEFIVSRGTHPKLALLERWLEQKRKQDARAAELELARDKREHFGNVARKLSEHPLLKDAPEEAIRSAIFKAKGISENEDDQSRRPPERPPMDSSYCPN